MHLVRIKPIPALAALASLALVPVTATALASAASASSAARAASPASRSVQEDGSERRQIYTFRFDGGTAQQYFEQARAQLTEWGREEWEQPIPNLILLPGLDKIEVPAVSLAFVISDAQGLMNAVGETLGAITEVELPSVDGTVATILLNDNTGPAIRIVPEFQKFVEPGTGAVRTGPLPAPRATSDSVVVLSVGTVDLEAALGAASAAIKLAGLGDRTELMVHEQSGTILARTTIEGEAILFKVIEAAKTQRESLDRSPAIEAVRRYEMQVGSLQFKIERLEEENRQLNALVQVREREIVEMNRALVKLETALQQATQTAAGKQP
ncbi:MAG: hypothetical protein GC172_02730 [Phycisphaera sp.]|nr:hypothetical protein [Phycisphaera sp.]